MRRRANSCESVAGRAVRLRRGDQRPYRASWRCRPTSADRQRTRLSSGEAHLYRLENRLLRHRASSEKTELGLTSNQTIMHQDNPFGYSKYCFG